MASRLAVSKLSNILRPIGESFRALPISHSASREEYGYECHGDHHRNIEAQSFHHRLRFGLVPIDACTTDAGWLQDGWGRDSGGNCGRGNGVRMSHQVFTSPLLPRFSNCHTLMSWAKQ